MGCIFKKTITRPLPNGAEVVTKKGERLARWRGEGGKIHEAPVFAGKDGSERIRDHAATYYTRYRDGSGLVVETSTGCRDESAARQVLADRERRAERQRAGLISPAEDRRADHMAAPIAAHIDAYLTAMEAAGTTEARRKTVAAYLRRLVVDCEFRKLGDLRREALERWLAAETRKGRSAASRNGHHIALIAFANWLCDPSIGRLGGANPFRGIPKADERSDPRRKRRAMTADELTRLLAVAGDRAILYKTLALTGMRQGELASLTVAQRQLDAPVPHVRLEAAAEKNREGNAVVLRADLVEDLRARIADRPGGTAPVFDVPSTLIRIYNRDLAAAGIPKRDDRGRTIDLHALRTTFGTLLLAAGVPLRTVQAAMRHSTPTLTAGVYCDQRLLDVAGAPDSVPDLPIVAHGVAHTGDVPSPLLATSGNPSPKTPHSCPQATSAADGAPGYPGVTMAASGIPCPDRPFSLA